MPSSRTVLRALARPFAACLVAAVSLLTSAPALADPGLYPIQGDLGWAGDVNLAVGSKSLGRDDWSPVDDQSSFGVLIDLRREDWPLGLALDVFRTSDDSRRVEGETTEIGLGMRKVWHGLLGWHPYVGGGLALIRDRLEIGSDSDEDTGLGLWVGGGLFLTIARHLNLGFDLRWSTAETTLFGERVDAGGTLGSLLVGYHL